MKITAQRLKLLREEKKLSEYEFGKAIGVKEKFIKQWEKAVLQPRPKELAIIAKYYGVSSDYIIGLKENRI